MIVEHVMQFKPNDSGFICSWLTSGPYEKPYQTDYFNPNQLEFEKKVREAIADGSMQAAPDAIRLGRGGLPGHPWAYYQSGNNWFVDFSTFYFLLTKVELYAATTLVSPERQTVHARLWTFAAVEVWCNGKKVGAVKEPVYKPIVHMDLDLELCEGCNDIFIRMQNLGVRDTRNIFGLQLLGYFENITVEMPDFERVYPIAVAERQLMQVRLQDARLALEETLVFPIEVEGVGMWSSGGSFDVPADAQRLCLRMRVNGTELRRTIENAKNIRPVYAHTDSLEAHRQYCLDVLLEARDVKRAAVCLNAVFASIVRNDFREADLAVLRKALPGICKREDCADFLALTALRILLSHGEMIPAQDAAAFKEALLNFRYWMDEDGADGMCFWSENHALGFYACQLMAGKLYPAEFFPRSGRTGAEQYEIGNARSREWLDSIEQTWFEEFLSPGYMNVTMQGLLALIDYAEPDVSERAWKVLDHLLRMASLHVFDGALIAPCGRIYHDVIQPHTQSFQSTLSYFNEAVPLENISDVSGYAPLLVSKYKEPADLTKLMSSEIRKTYQTGNAEITICKTKNYILTSAASERSERFQGGWSSADYVKENPYETGNFSFMYVKALNERYHGTTLFQPGVFGYQQHLWSAAVSNVCNVMVNHPGATNQASKMRPGYWYGNGLMPAIRQWDNVLGTIYQLDEKHPVNFTHLYFPVPNFDRALQDGNWIFGQSGEGLVAVWCSTVLQPHNDVLTDCEFRAYGKNQAYACICSDVQTEGSFEQFCNCCRAAVPHFCEANMMLDLGGGRKLQFIPKVNNTQAI